MIALRHHEFHDGLGARFGELNGSEIVTDYGEPGAECRFLTESVGVIDLSFRGRICVLGQDRSKFLHGQLTNEIKRLQSGQGCYSALVTNKGKIQSDLNVHCLENEILLDFEPGLTDLVKERIERFVVADDVELCDVSEAFGVVSVQGPKAAEAISKLELPMAMPDGSHAVTWTEDETLGPIYLVCHPRLGGTGFDVYAADESVPAIADKLIAAARELDGGSVGWGAFEQVRIVTGIPRFGQDMTEDNLAPEAGIEDRAIAYDKGCYIGQEVLNRLHNFAEVSRSLRVLSLPKNAKPSKGDAIFADDKQVGEVTSAAALPGASTPTCIGFVRKGHKEIGAKLRIGDDPAEIVGLPFGAQAE